MDYFLALGSKGNTTSRITCGFSTLSRMVRFPADLALSRTLVKSAGVWTEVCAASMMMSPGRMPFSAAGPEALTSVTTKPLV